ncbi:MAG: hypothetical protein H0T46_02895 [Deltaproteobacteria bacterium]|nr:hypothetical protein [Deltaproteobacteria bacterium]
MRWMFASAGALLLMATPALAAPWHVATDERMSSGGCDASRPGGGIVIGIALIAVRRRQGRLR